MDRLFNFFVAVTKVTHLSHVVVMTSLIEEIYASSALKNTSELYLGVISMTRHGFPESGEELLEMKKLVEGEGLFCDPLKRNQTKLDEKVSRKLVGRG